MRRLVACLVVILSAGATLRAGELDAEFGPKAPFSGASLATIPVADSPSAAPDLVGNDRPDLATSSELDRELPSQSHFRLGRCFGLGFGRGGFGWGGLGFGGLGYGGWGGYGGLGYGGLGYGGWGGYSLYSSSYYSPFFGGYGGYGGLGYGGYGYGGFGYGGLGFGCYPGWGGFYW